jgi:nucleotide-binding universal stress UspA family protein
MRTILIPVDASDCAKRAALHAAKMASGNPDLQLHLLNVQEPVGLRMHAAMATQDIKDIQAAEAQRVLNDVMQFLNQAGAPCHAEWRSGEIASAIAAYAREIDCEGVIMGTRGMGAVGNLVLGSVALKVAHLVEVPVTLVK